MAKLPEAWKKLQNGSDIRGVALEGGGDAVNLTEQHVAWIAAAFAGWLHQQQRAPDAAGKQLRVCIGHDSRLSAAALKAAAARGLHAAGVHVADFGLASTPAMFMSTVLPGHMYDGAIMLTASHLPSNRNGLKFFTAAGGLESADITAVLLAASQLEAAGGPAAVGSTAIHEVPFMDTYAGHLVNVIRKSTGRDQPLAGFKIIVDAGNGAGGFFVGKVLVPLGADTTGSQFLEPGRPALAGDAPDGHFPNHIPNPEDHEAMKAASEATLASKADLGIIFDTDVDRAAVVDADGTEINRDRLIALLAAIVLQEHPGSTIVTDSVTSNGLAEFIASRGGRHHRFKRGYKNVINEGIKLNAKGEECHLAIETSGHGAMKENYFLDDGAYLVVKVLVQLAQLNPPGASQRTGLRSLFGALREPVEDEEFRFKIAAPDFVAAGSRAIDDLRHAVATSPGWSLVPNNFEGVRIACDAEHGDGWCLLRLSLHDPVLPLNVQSDRAGGVATIVRQLQVALGSTPDIDLAPLAKYLAAHPA